MTELIPSDVVKAIQDSVATETISIVHRPLNDEAYFTRPVYLPPPEPSIQVLKINTLQGLIDYLTQNPEPQTGAAFIHIVSQTCVRLYAGVNGRHNTRALLIEADCDRVIGQGFSFGTYLPVDQMIVNLQSQFQPSPDREAILAVIGNLRNEKVQTYSDDGVSQAVTTRAGIARVGTTEVPNPVTLFPYRTFREVDQPSSEFIFRMQQAREGEMPKCALFEADGGAWKLFAIERIQAHLETSLIIPILA